MFDVTRSTRFQNGDAPRIEKSSKFGPNKATLVDFAYNPQENNKLTLFFKVGSETFRKTWVTPSSDAIQKEVKPICNMKDAEMQERAMKNYVQYYLKNYILFGNALENRIFTDVQSDFDDTWINENGHFPECFTDALGIIDFKNYDPESVALILAATARKFFATVVKFFNARKDDLQTALDIEDFDEVVQKELENSFVTYTVFKEGQAHKIDSIVLGQGYLFLAYEVGKKYLQVPFESSLVKTYIKDNKLNSVRKSGMSANCFFQKDPQMDMAKRDLPQIAGELIYFMTGVVEPVLNEGGFDTSRSDLGNLVANHRDLNNFCYLGLLEKPDQNKIEFKVILKELTENSKVNAAEVSVVVPEAKPKSKKVLKDDTLPEEDIPF